MSIILEGKDTNTEVQYNFYQERRQLKIMVENYRKKWVYPN